MKRELFLALVLTAVTTGVFGPASAGADEPQTGAPDSDNATEVSPLDELLDDAEDCVLLNRIDRTDVIDDQTILFHVKGGEIYANRLPHRCPGLRRNKSIMYKTSLNKLCSVDVITVLDNMGFGLSRGASCGLGSFVPVSEATVELLRESR